ncbi:MAG: hypothetical protein AAF797_00180 [Planctomycetota bacterium]
MPTVTQSLFRLVLARPAQTPAGDHPSLIDLTWFITDAAPPGHLVQLFIDGEKYATLPALPNQYWLSLDRTRPHTIELLAVTLGQADQDLRSHLNTWSPTYTLQPALELTRDPSAPLNATTSITDDAGQTLATALIWPPDVPRGGFGSLFGVSAFGLDNAASPGLGRAPLGHGPLDLDAPPLSPDLPPLPAGTHPLTATTSHTPDAPVQTTVVVNLPEYPTAHDTQA